VTRPATASCWCCCRHRCCGAGDRTPCGGRE
jgi:hypothetical protein